MTSLSSLVPNKAIDWCDLDKQNCATWKYWKHNSNTALIPTAYVNNISQKYRHNIKESL